MGLGLINHQNNNTNDSVEISHQELFEAENNGNIIYQDMKNKQKLESEQQLKEVDVLKKKLLEDNNEDIPKNITDILIDMLIADQQVRKKGLINDLNKTDALNQLKLKELFSLYELGRYDWSKKYNVGEYKFTVETLIRTIVQHADADIDLQKWFLQEYNNKISQSHKAYLTDRIAVNTRQSQVYATQGLGEGESRYFRPISGISIDNKNIQHTKNSKRYIELNEQDIAYIDTKRNEGEIGRTTSEYYKNMSNKPGLMPDGKIKMLIDFI